MKYSESKFSKLSFDEAVQLFTPVDRIIIKLYRYGLSSEDIAIIVNGTEKMVKYKISRIKKTLGRIMGDTPFTPLREV